MAAPLRLVVCGASGRMGARVAALAAGDPRFRVAAVVRHLRPAASPGAATLAASELSARVGDADVLVDFSVPEASARFAAAAASTRRPIVIGTTGFTPAQRKALDAAARRTAVFVSPNFSPGMSLVFALARRAARALPGFDAWISETHHAAKRDSPSGTALRLAEAVKASRPGRTVGVSSARAGDIVGEHTLLLAGPFERVEITHRAHSRDAFARGALEAALWVRGRRPGLYSMDDLLGVA